MDYSFFFREFINLLSSVDSIRFNGKDHFNSKDRCHAGGKSSMPAPASNSYWLLYNEGVDLNIRIMFDLFVFLIVQQKRELTKSTLITPL